MIITDRVIRGENLIYLVNDRVHKDGSYYNTLIMGKW